MKTTPKPQACPGSKLANRIADELMTNYSGERAERLHLIGPNEVDLGGLGRFSVVNFIDKVLDAEAMRKAKPALLRKIQRILKRSK